jgi:serine O-acetyltransferase
MGSREAQSDHDWRKIGDEMGLQELPSETKHRLCDTRTGADLKLKFLVCADLYRYYGRVSRGLLMRELVLGIGFKYSFWLRVAQWSDCRSGWWAPLLLFAKLVLRRYTFKFGIAIPYRTQIGPGFYIGHFGGITVSPDAKIGQNCNISQDVTIGRSNRGERAGAPTVGDGVYIGPGAKLIGRISIGNNVAIGANCVVTRDVPDDAVVVGVPGRVISREGAKGYVNRTDFQETLVADSR